MKSNLFLKAAAVAAIFGSFAFLAEAQSTRPSSRPSRNSAETLARSKNNEAFRQILTPVVEQAVRATARIRSNGKDIALATVVDSAGLLVTKASELSGPITVVLFNGKSLPATVVGIVQEYDLAMIRINIADLEPAQWSDTKEAVGEFVACPFADGDEKAGTTQKPVIGVVSVERRKISNEYSGGYLGIAFATSIGPNGQPRLDLKGEPRIQTVQPSTPAATAGIKDNDVFTAVDGVAMTNIEQVQSALRERLPGTKVKITLLRDNKKVDVTATLGSRMQMSNRTWMQNTMGGSLSRVLGGFATALQHDIALKPTDVGGPLVNLDGKVIGINISRSGRVETYAIPADVVVKLIPDLKAGKYPKVLTPATRPATQPADPTPPQPRQPRRPGSTRPSTNPTP